MEESHVLTNSFEVQHFMVRNLKGSFPFHKETGKDYLES